MKELNEYKNIWVYLETKDGKLKNVGLELLNPGRMLADATGEKLVGVLIGDGVSALADEVIAHGADSVIVVDAPEYASLPYPLTRMEYKFHREEMVFLHNIVLQSCLKHLPLYHRRLR